MQNSESLASEIDVHEACRQIESVDSLLLIDCREPFEYEICRIAGSTLIPMHQIPQQIETLRSHQERNIIVYCHHGVRSLHVVRWLRQNGFSRAQSLAGGIESWAIHIDRELPRY